MYLNPFQQLLYDFEIHLSTPRTTEGLAQLLQKVQMLTVVPEGAFKINQVIS